MNRFVTEELYRIPELRLRLDRAAHRERNRALRAAFARLWNGLMPRFEFHPGEWMERLG